MRRSRVEAVGGYDPTLRARGGEGFEDHALYVALAERWNFAVVPRYLIAYRRHPAAMSRNSRSMARSGALVLADLRSRRPDLRGYRLGRCQAVYHREILAGTFYRHEWSKLPAVLSCAAREGGAWCMLDLLARQVPARVADHCLRRLMKDPLQETGCSQPSVDVFWPLESSMPIPLPETNVGDTRPPAAAMPLKSVS